MFYLTENNTRSSICWALRMHKRHFFVREIFNANKTVFVYNENSAGRLQKNKPRDPFEECDRWQVSVAWLKINPYCGSVFLSWEYNHYLFSVSENSQKGRDFDYCFFYASFRKVYVPRLLTIRALPEKIRDIFIPGALNHFFWVSL